MPPALASFFGLMSFSWMMCLAGFCRLMVSLSSGPCVVVYLAWCERCASHIGRNRDILVDCVGSRITGVFVPFTSWILVRFQVFQLDG